MAPSIVDYRAILRSPTALPAPDPGTVVRIESPGRATDLHLSLLEAGVEFAEEEGSPVVKVNPEIAQQYERGRILSPRQWYLGFRATLEAVRNRLARWSPLYSSHPDDIALLFDKPRCHATLGEAGLRVPRTLGPIASFPELDAKMTQAGVTRVFVKLAHGSAASGIVAYRRSSHGDLAYTTVESVQHGRGMEVYNTRRLRRLTRRAEIASVVNALCPHGVQVEQWIPKAGLDGRTFDLRVLSVAGEPAHTVIRLAQGPITNLHLRGRRAPLHRLHGRMSDHSFARLRTACRRAARLFPRSLQVAFDIAITPDHGSHAVLEANAFGDLLKGITHAGETTYEAELNAAGRLAPGCSLGSWYLS